LIDVVDFQPKKAIILINVELQLDFKKALDYIEETEVDNSINN
jgi:hypothetical protein